MAPEDPEREYTGEGGCSILLTPMSTGALGPAQVDVSLGTRPA